MIRLAIVISTLFATAAIAEPYGRIGSFTAKPGQRAALAKVLLDGTRAMPGCIDYVVAEDIADADRLWITEVWRDKASHDASLSLPQVRAAISKGRPLIASMGDGGAETRVLGGILLPRR